jgi:hypothetical protein
VSISSIPGAALNRRPATTYVETISPTETHKICSVYPRPFTFSVHGYVTLPACDDKTPKENLGEVDGIRYSFVEVLPGLTRKDESVDTGDQFIEKYYVERNIPARAVALDTLGYSLDRSYAASETRASQSMVARGVFVPAGKNPTKEELLAAKDALMAGAAAAFDAAQMEWAQYRKTTNIDENARVAAHLLGESPEWLGGQKSSSIGAAPKKTTEELIAETLARLVALTEAKTQAASAPNATNVTPKR